MLKIQEIREIIKLIDHSSIEKFSFESEGTKIVLKKSSASKTVKTLVETEPTVQVEVAEVRAATVEPVEVKKEAPIAPAAVELVEDPTLHKITSPMVGTFYSASSPEVAAFVQQGDKVNTESIVCIVEAMKLFNEIEAEVTGEIVEILVKDGQLVEYGQPLFLVKTN
ncbi:acetyl-CoA carboxylase biotin carboxyl carrier protein [Filibacter tadaridae]|uniref:Biotin carboxyl carrier protein of acetyl-CoA carboxylase n=1 Tax=Filibacter tadaridae TaxID=2483811 RepID=A0A3P5XTH4_9BACL|nr:acetyl-CoA carboxylase biotin carboxyl carrier protein [Filibacter tadaridae]VDC32401.1 Biotin carboxyl carrier protein of acetyl-CoA carboxylase [Filibacter tadaridae]